VFQVQLAIQVSKDFKAILVLWALLGPLANLGPQVPKETVEIPVLLDRLDCLELQVLMVLLVQSVRLVVLVLQDQTELLV
jgi:hypothetical protein